MPDFETFNELINPAELITPGHLQKSWYRILCYLHEPPRQVLYIQTGRQWWRLVGGPATLPKEQSRGCGRSEEYVACCGPTLEDVKQREQSGLQGGKGVSKCNIVPDEAGPHIGKTPNLKKVIQFFIKHLTSPLKS